MQNANSDVANGIFNGTTDRPRHSTVRMLYEKLAVTLATRGHLFAMTHDCSFIIALLGREARSTATFRKKLNSFLLCCDPLKERPTLISKYRRKGTISPITRNETKYFCF